MRARAWIGSKQVWSGPINANTIRLTPPGIDPSWQSESAFDFLLFTIPEHTIERIAGGAACRIHDRFRRPFPLYFRDPVVVDLGRKMLDACNGGSRYARQFADGLGFALVAHLLSRYNECIPAAARAGLSPSDIRQVTQYIENHLSEDMRVTELARAINLSASHFAHAFRASTGISPHRFVLTARIDKAQQMLCDGRKSISEVALDCGFKNTSHFARTFRASTGVTPREFRKLR